MRKVLSSFIISSRVEADMILKPRLSDLFRLAMRLSMRPLHTTYLQVQLTLGFSFSTVSEYDQEMPQSQTADQPMADYRRTADYRPTQEETQTATT